MDPNTRALIMGAAGAGSAEKIYVEDVFSTWLYAGNNSTQTITNGIDISGKGGLVWIKRKDLNNTHHLFDTTRGATNYQRTNSTDPQVTDTTTLTAFSSSGFTLSYSGQVNGTGNYVSWTFREAPKFFDVVSWTGNGASSRTISHSLGSTPGFIIIKSVDYSPANWQCWHRSISTGTLSGNNLFKLNSTDAANSVPFIIGSVSSTTFEIGSDSSVNQNFASYVAYVFAHDAGGFGDSGNESVIKCGSYTGNGSATGPTVTLDWEPQWLLIKRTDSTGDWNLIDNMRGFVVGGADAELNPNLSIAESSGTFVTPLPTGFQLNTTDAGYNANAGTYIYIAIRRGPMKTPTDATKVFQSKVYTGDNTDNRLVATDIVTDMAWVRQRDDGTLTGMVVGDRLRGQPYLLTGTTAIEVDDADSFDKEIVSATEYGSAFTSMTGFWVGNDPTSKLNINTTSNNHVAYAFRRAPGFFDVVAYTGTGSARTVSHNLGVAPQLMIVKGRGPNQWNWNVYHAAIGATKYLLLDSNAAEATASRFNDTAPTASVFSIGTSGTVNGSSDTYIAYLFASCPGVSKVGSYTGTGTTLSVDCGFTNGARFVLIKRTDITGDWYVWDTARGIVANNDPYLLLNSTAAEVTNTDYIDPLSSGFQISSTAPAAINANGGSYIYLAIA